MTKTLRRIGALETKEEAEMSIQGRAGRGVSIIEIAADVQTGWDGLT